MFSHEFLVVINDPGRGDIVSIHVDKSIVRMTEPGPPTASRAVDGFLRVEAGGSGERVNVMLPVASAEFGRVVSVPEELLAQSVAG